MMFIMLFMNFLSHLHAQFLSFSVSYYHTKSGTFTHSKSCGKGMIAAITEGGSGSRIHFSNTVIAIGLILFISL